MKRFYIFIFSMMVSAGLFAQGATTSAMTGTLSDGTGETLIGATIEATHTPTGTKYGTVTDVNGSYQIVNMRVGGPYTIKASYVGFEDKMLEGVFLKLGEKFVLNLELDEASLELMQVDVVASRYSAGQNAGAGTNVSERAIETLPTINRDINDFTRTTPQASTATPGLSVAGTNNRYNAIYFDGAANNDMFGLASSGTNGGQTGFGPISVDAIDQIQVMVAPYDVVYGGFAGGGINAVTKSGTNEFKGTAYYFLQNENLVGKTNGTLIDRIGAKDADRERVDEFTNTLYGLSLGGPIIKNKVFFFVNAELEDRETPAPFEVGDYLGNSSVEDLNNLRDVLRTRYGYEAGSFGDKADVLEGSRILARLDFNLSQDHKLTLRHNYVNGELTNTNASNTRRINFENNGLFFPSTTNSTSLELNSSFGSNMANKLILSYTSVRDDRDPLANPFPAVFINDGQGSISFGSEPFSTANQLDQDVFTLTNNFKLFKGRHTITLGTHNEFLSVYNLFIRQNFGSYEYGSLEDFLNDAPPEEYDRSFSLVDNITGDGSAAAAEFNAMQLGFYVQDEFQVTDRLNITGGIRLDIPVMLDDPEGDAESFDPNGLINANYDLKGATPGAAPSGQLMWAPRFGFNYDASGDRSTVIRGGFGVFTSRIPFVWPGGMFTNNGQSIGGIDENDPESPESFIPDPFGQPGSDNIVTPSGQLDLFAEDFKYPQVARGSFAVDKSFGSGWNATVEGIYTKTLNNVFYQNVNSSRAVDFNWTNGADGFDDRPVYEGERLDPRYSAIYVASNTDEGFTYNLTAQISKSFNNGLSFMAAYTHSDAEAIFEGTSSQNSSQWRGAIQTDGRNFAELGRSDFSVGHRFIASLDYELNWTKDGNLSTGVNVFYNGQAGRPYSYVYDVRNPNNEVGSTSRERSLIYVPQNRDDIVLVDIEGGLTADEQWERLDQFIEDDRYLQDRRGRYAEKNGARAPWQHQIDVRLTQNLGTIIGGYDNKLELTIDIFNFLNLVHRDWGTQYTSPFVYEILNFEGYDADGTTPTFTFTETREDLDRFGINDFLSRWRGRIGIRYRFN